MLLALVSVYSLPVLLLLTRNRSQLGMDVSAELRGAELTHSFLRLGYQWWYIAS